MPPKSKRRRQLEKCLEIARAAKRRKKSLGAVENEKRNEVISVDHAAESEELDSTFDVDSEKYDKDHIKESFCDEWVSQLNRESKIFLLCFQLPKHFGLSETETAEIAEMMRVCLTANHTCSQLQPRPS